MLPIAQVLDRMPGLSLRQKAVLNQVCGLAENGQRRQCDASNTYLADRLRPCSERTITRTLTELEARGLILSRGKGKARRLWPVEALRACYLTANAAEQEQAVRVLATVANLDETGPNLDTNLDIPAPNLDTNLDKTDPQPSQSGEVEGAQPRHNGSANLDTMGRQPRQNGSRVLGDDQYDHSNPVEVEALRSAVAAAQKKIEELTGANAELAEQLELVTTQRDQLRASFLAQRPGGANASASHTGGARRLDFAQSRYATPEGFRELAGKINCATACVEYYLPDMLTKAEDLEQRDEPGWKLWVMSWLKRDRDGSGLVTKMPTKAESKLGTVRAGVDEARELLRRKREGGQGNG